MSVIMGTVVSSSPVAPDSAPPMAAAVVSTAPAAPTMMQVNVPDGVVGGQPIAVQANGQMMQVTVPDGLKPGDAFQVQVPAPVAPVAAVASSSSIPMAAATVAPSSVPFAASSVAPMGTAALDAQTRALGVSPVAAMQGGMSYPAPPSLVAPQGQTCTLPAPVRTSACPPGKQPVNASAPPTHTHTGSPHITHQFYAPPAPIGVMSEADFGRACVVAGAIDASDPFGPHLKGAAAGARMTLDVDLAGRQAELQKNMNNNCGHCCCSFWCLGCLCPSQADKSCGEELTPTQREALEAHSVVLYDDCVVYTRRPFTAQSIRTAVAFDQYGHRFPACGVVNEQLPATTISIPLSRLTVEIVPRSEVVQALTMGTWDCCACCAPDMEDPKGHVVALKAGDGLKVVVACVEVGAASNAAAFAAAVAGAAASAPPESPALTAAFTAWFSDRLARSGRMAGAQTPWNASMQRSFREANPTAPSFKKCVGPLQSAALEGNQPVLGGLTMTANGQIFTPHDSQLIDQLNAGDTITGVNGVPFEHLPSGGIFASSNLLRADRYKPWLAKVEAAGNALPPHARAMEVLTSMPYFMPNHLVTVSVPPMHLAHLGIDANDAKPPLIAQPTPTALGLGFAPGDVLVTVVADGMQHDATTYTAGELLQRTASASGPLSITVLQTTRVGSLSHPHTWPHPTRPMR